MKLDGKQKKEIIERLSHGLSLEVDRRSNLPKGSSIRATQTNDARRLFRQLLTSKFSANWVPAKDFSKWEKVLSLDSSKHALRLTPSPECAVMCIGQIWASDRDPISKADEESLSRHLAPEMGSRMALLPLIALYGPERSQSMVVCATDPRRESNFRLFEIAIDSASEEMLPGWRLVEGFLKWDDPLPRMQPEDEDEARRNISTYGQWS